MEIKINILPNTYQEEKGFPFCMNKICIGDIFCETNMMALNIWSIDDYQKQWQEGLQRVISHDVSCLVVSIQHPCKTPPLINWWLLYKINNQICLQNQLLVDDEFRENIGSQYFSPDTCYDFIPPYQTISSGGFAISQWWIEL